MSSYYLERPLRVRRRPRLVTPYIAGLGATPSPSCPTWMPSTFCIAQTQASSSSVQSCVDKANATSQVKGIDAEVARLAGWNPTGYFTPAEVKSLLDELATQAAAAGDALAKTPRWTSDDTDLINQAFEDLKRKYQAPALSYEQAYKQALSAGARAIDAPGLKDWVVRSMRAISDAYVTATVIQCNQSQSLVLSILDRGYRAAVTIGGVAWRVVGVAVKVGENIVKAAEAGAGLIKYLPYAAVGVAALFIWREVRSR